MAGQTQWWLFKNSLQPTNAHVLHEVHDPFGAASSRQAAKVAAFPDEGKREMFGGGRRVRARSQDAPPFGVAQPRLPGSDALNPHNENHAPAQIRHGRRASSELLTSGTESTSLQLPPNPKPQTISSRDWRYGDKQGVYFGKEPSQPQARTICPDTSWRLAKDEPLTFSGPPQTRAVNKPVVDVSWRSAESGPLRLLDASEKIPPESGSSTPRRHANWPARDANWRSGEDYHLSSQERPSRVPADGERVVCDQAWRLGDPQPFSIDGRPVEREPLDAFRTARQPRVTSNSDPRPFTLSGAHVELTPPSTRSSAEPPLVAAAMVPGGGLMPKPTLASVRERRLTHEHDKAVERLSEIRPLEEVVLNLRRGEVRF